VTSALASALLFTRRRRRPVAATTASIMTGAQGLELASIDKVDTLLICIVGVFNHFKNKM
jgi:hypothetical protein